MKAVIIIINYGIIFSLKSWVNAWRKNQML